MTWLIASKVTRQFSLSIFQTTRWNAPRAVPHLVGEHASKRVGRTASRKRHYDSDRPRRKRLCPRQTAAPRRDGHPMEKRSPSKVHNVRYQLPRKLYQGFGRRSRCFIFRLASASESACSFHAPPKCWRHSHMFCMASDFPFVSAGVRLDFEFAANIADRNSGY
jgi:hypothetical protein